MDTPNPLIIIGSANMDMVIKTSHFPKPGETLIGGEFFFAPGGKGANQAVAAARVGGKVVFVCRLGKDVFGEKFMENFQNEGIETEFVTVDPDAPTGVAQITVDKKGENTILVASGANLKLCSDDIMSLKSLISPASTILMQLECPLEPLLFAAKTAFELGAKVILNPAPAQSLPDELMAHLYLITPNEWEAFTLTGVEILDEKTAAEAAEIFLEKGVKNVIITLGEKGAYLHTETYKGILSAEKVKVVDTTAAGDTFNGVLAVQIAQGKSMVEAVKLANRAAALSVQKMGAQPSIPFLSEL
ncbi:ribokinase [Pararhodonellum marinum]|uniref:ribokinase n=1 Tax=Pararhodonellum marinum TaxID=2755358 RepID=UPI00188E9847|nr:ribokinase [Pararhodonellum marinum]